MKRNLKITKVQINKKAIVIVAHLIQMKMNTMPFEGTLSSKYVHILLVTHEGENAQAKICTMH